MNGTIEEAHDSRNDSGGEAPASSPWWRKHPVIAVAVTVGVLALAAGLLALALLIALWIWIVASGGLFPNK